MPAPRLPVTEAAARLEAAGQPFLFFVNAGTGCGNLIDHRCDGHYGRIAPVGCPWPGLASGPSATPGAASGTLLSRLWQGEAVPAVEPDEACRCHDPHPPQAVLFLLIQHDIFPTPRADRLD